MLYDGISKKIDKKLTTGGKTMFTKLKQYSLTTVVATSVALTVLPAFAGDHLVQLRMSTPASATDARSVALQEVFAPAVAGFASYEPHYNGSLIKQIF